MKEEIRAFIEAGEGDFDDLALRLHAWQKAHNAQLAAFCAEAEPAAWHEIPAVPVALFRDLPLTCFPPAEARVLFRTSGTTGAARGQVRLQDTELYDLGARLHAEACIGSWPEAGVFLLPDAGDSSLSHMCRSFVERAAWFVRGGGLDVEALTDTLEELEEPCFVATTAFALAELLDHGGRWELVEGSVLMVTGGFKGRRSDVPVDALSRGIDEAFAGVRVVLEYGMTELSSQLWAADFDAPYHPPPWMRVQAVEPWTGEPAERGLLRFFDLASHQTTLAIETSDVGRVLDDGSVMLEGRLAGAEPRGCSLTIEELRR